MEILTFLYFAYGSNLLAERIHINNPTAVRRGIARLENYRLDFAGYFENWRGAPSTIVPDPTAHVWGALWEINQRDLKDLDHQEGVDGNEYFALEVSVQRPDGTFVKCRVYQQCKNPQEFVHPSQLPRNRQPSLSYLNTMILGAEQSRIPRDYINFIKSIKHNGQAGTLSFSNPPLTL